MKKILALLSLLLCLVGCSSGNNSKLKVGVVQLTQHQALDSATDGFVHTLKAKYGENIDIIVENGSGDSNTCSTIATNFVADGVDLIMANATPALLAAKNATDSIPVLGTSVTEYGVALGIDNFNGVCGGKVSGTSGLAPLDQQAQMILELLPETKVVGIIYCTAEANSLYQVNEVEKYLKELNVEVKVFKFTDSNDLSAVVQTACEDIDVLYVPTDNTCASNGPLIADAADKNNVPIITGEKECCLSVGGLATLSIDYYELGKVTGEMAIKVLEGEDISKMPVEWFQGPQKLIDMDKAATFGVKVPSDYTSIK